MKKILSIVSLMILVACGEKSKIDHSKDTPVQTVQEEIKKGSFELSFDMEQTAANEYEILAYLSLHDGAYVISPHSADKTYLQFDIKLAENKHFNTSGNLIEIPTSKEEMDPILKEPVRFVRSKTVYKQKLVLTSNADFTATGAVEFLLEPNCVPYDITFDFSSKNGEMHIAKTNTAIAASYYR